MASTLGPSGLRCLIRSVKKNDRAYTENGLVSEKRMLQNQNMLRK